MKRYDIAVYDRAALTKGQNRRLRISGRIPAVVYGGPADPKKVALDAHQLGILLKNADAEKAMFSLNFDGQSAGEESIALIREIQRDPVTRRILHVDLYKIRMDVENVFEIPVHMLGTAAGIKQGGILESHRRSVEVRCLPAKLPSYLEVDLTPLTINHSLHVSDLTLPEGVSLVTPGDDVICTVLPPKTEVVAAAPTEEPQLPELVGKKKAEEEPAEKK